MSSLRRTVFTILTIVCALPMVAQSVYTLETLPADQFEPSIGFESIIGLHMDPQGNITGLAAKGTQRQLGFYWPSNGNPVRKLVFATPSSTEDCEPSGIDAQGLAYVYCEGISLNAVYEPSSRKYRELSLPGGGSFEIHGAGGDSWSVGHASSHGQSTGVRRAASGVVDTLAPISPDLNSIAVAVNSKGAATGQSFLSNGEATGDGAVPPRARAVLWKQGSNTGEPIPARVGASWMPALGRAINDDLVVTGSTSPLPGACTGTTSEQAGSVGFVSALRSSGDRFTEFLPLLPGDKMAATMTPRGINIHSAIVGTREDCGTGGTLSGRRAILWKLRDGAWSANVLDRYPISLDTGICASDLVLTEARAINDSGQITGAGDCIDSEGSRRSIAYRLTPTGVEAP